MKVRTITLSIEVQPDDFVEKNGVYPIGLKLEEAKRSLDRIATSLRAASYDVQTLRVAFNSLEEWLVAGTREAAYYVTVVQILVKHLIAHSIDFCSIGCCSTMEALALVPALLAVSDRLYCSALFKKTAEHDIAPDLSLIRQAAKSMLAVSEASGVLGCFRFCASFNCAGGTPFFPAAYFDGDKNETNDQSPDKLTKNKNGSLVSIGLECGDLLFIGFHGAECASQGSRYLSDVLRQALLPVQVIVSSACDSLNINYGGIDASINPGLSLPDSVGAGLENLLYFPKKATSSLPPIPSQQFGEFGTLSAVSAVTKAVKSLPENGIKTIGYNGLMLPVMEDLVLAERAAQTPPTFTLRDLLTFSAVCGVGLDTVPVPGNITEETVCAVYMETAALAFRLNKPLSCRLLPMKDKKAGDFTDIDHPYICNTRVFHV